MAVVSLHGPPIVVNLPQYQLSYKPSPPIHQAEPQPKQTDQQRKIKVGFVKHLQVVSDLLLMQIAYHCNMRLQS